MAPWVGSQCLIVVFPRHTHFLFDLVFLQEDVHNFPEVMVTFYLKKVCV